MTEPFWAALAVGSLWILGVWTLFQPGMILGLVGDWGEWLSKRWWGTDYVVKPIYRCPRCMASLHGTVIWFLFGGDFWRWTPFCVCLCGLLTLFTVFLSDE